MSGACSATVVKVRAMRTRGWIIPAAVLVIASIAAGSSAQPASPVAPRGEPPAEPVVVELFTAQGCAGCPEANTRVEALADTPGVIALTYAVDYWDYLGWPDTFARPEFAQRQRAYRRPLKLRAIGTPQVVIDGRRQVPGAGEEALKAAVEEEAARRVFPPEIEFREAGDRVGVGSGRVPAGGAEVVAVVYRPGPQTVQIERGDNRGQTVRHVNVVRSVRSLGDWTGRPALYDLPDGLAADEAVAVLVQARADRRILNGAVLPPR
ncbi:thioredoxin family protein [Brevundimonas basaltis]